ncbi:MAG: flippase-like domain-containing protein [Phycisphaerae bacterium]|nr:flippase-like domain-containing protein [Phycisphaerae bacterium]
MSQIDPPNPDPRQQRRSRILKAVRLSVALAALAIILGSIQYRDLLVRDGREFQIVAQTDLAWRVRSPEGQTLTIEKPAADYDLRPGAVNLLQNLRIGPAVYALLIFGPIPPLLAWRWRVLLRVVGVAADYLLVFKLTYAGTLMNFFLIGTTGGDVVKAYWISRIKKHPAEVFVSAFVDRFVGLATIILLAGFLILILHSEPLMARWSYQVGLLLVLLSAAVLVLFSSRLRRLIRFDRWSSRLPFSSVIARIDRSLLDYRRQPRAVLAALALTLVLQLVAATSAWLLGVALRIDAPVWYYWTYVPLAFLIGSIPVSAFWGVGLLEGAYYTFFAAAGLATGTQAAMLAMGVRLVQLLWALPGGYVLAAGIPQETPDEPA